MTFQPPIPEHLRALSPYRAGRPISAVSREFGLDESSIIKLASNENPHGMSPKAAAALRTLQEDPARYPDPDGYELKAALAAHHGVPPDWLTLGCGSSELLAIAARAFLAPGRAGVLSQFSFQMYRSSVIAVGARPVIVPARSFGHDPEAMLTACGADASLVYLGNPNNPTGSWIPADQLSAIIARFPERVVLVLDEAYIDYVPEHERPDSVELARRHPNLIVLRTFSKIYGLAGLRIGYGIAQPAVTDVMNRLRPTFNANSFGQVAARAALADQEFLEMSRRSCEIEMRRLTSALGGMGVETLPSRANFILARFEDAAKANRALLERGIIVRHAADFGLGEWLRITIGTPRENNILIDALSRASP